MTIKDFKHLNKNDSSIAGGKGASLGEMMKTSVLVPPGFVILSSVFEKFLKEKNLEIKIDSILQRVNYKKIRSLENTSEEIQALISNVEIPENIAKEIKKSFKNLNSKYVAVRSSATAEDSIDSAWAGQLNSYLNIAEKDILLNIQKCWASLFNPRAIFYRFEKELHNEKISVAVVVQKMIKSESSGIAFSVHPVTQDKNKIIIEAGLGLGESIVSGAITPDSYVIEKKPRRIIDINVSSQRRGLFRANSGGNEWKSISLKDGGKQVLTNKQILELSKIIIDIEKHYGFPCDIEWALEKNKFYIVQSRPITTLATNVSSSDELCEYRKIMNRDSFLVDCECWYKGERFGVEKISKGNSYFEPLFIFEKNKGVGIYYNFSENNKKEDSRILAEFFNKNKKYFKEVAKEYKNKTKNIENLKNKISDIEKLSKGVEDFWPYLAIMFSLGDEINEAHKDIRKIAYDLRVNTDALLYNLNNKLYKVIHNSLPKNIKKYANVLLFKEIINKDFNKIREFEKRLKGFVYYKGKIITESKKQFFKNNNIYIKENIFDIKTIKKEKNIIYGSVAFAGKVTGRVKIVFKHGQMKKVKKGDILVTPMTTPDLLPAMDKANAFVTDEGGIICHAAIIAREMKKPCIIGTQIATQVLKDGDTVEIDANKGEVKILS